jgi:hypothetical protein
MGWQSTRRRRSGLSSVLRERLFGRVSKDENDLASIVATMRTRH